LENSPELEFISTGPSLLLERRPGRSWLKYVLIQDSVMNGIKWSLGDKEIATRDQINGFLVDLERTARHLLNLLVEKGSPDYLVPTAAEELITAQ
jgi:hypothetical protein